MIRASDLIYEDGSRTVSDLHDYDVMLVVDPREKRQPKEPEAEQEPETND